MPAIITPATIPFNAEFMVEESCCWYACANSMTFFARIMTPTAPMTAITSVFKLSRGYVIALVPAPDANTVIGSPPTARYAAPQNAVTAFFAPDNLPFPAFASAAIVSVPIVPEMLSVLHIKIISFSILVFKLSLTALSKRVFPGMLFNRAFPDAFLLSPPPFQSGREVHLPCPCAERGQL